MRRYLLGIVLVACVGGICCSGQQKQQKPISPLDSFVHHSAQKGDLVQLLEFTATTFALPMTIEIAQPYPAEIALPARVSSARQVLDLIVKASPEYGWEDRDGVVVVYNIHLKQSMGNVLNTRLQSFRMPENVGEFRLVLINSLAHPRNGVGGVIAGVEAPEVTALKLSSGKILENVTGREILIEACRENRKSFSVIVFPNDNPQTSTDREAAMSEWTMRSSSTLVGNPITLRTISPKPMKVR